MDVVIVESPAKARTIGTWLGRGYHVCACVSDHSKARISDHPRCGTVENILS